MRYLISLGLMGRWKWSHDGLSNVTQEGRENGVHNSHENSQNLCFIEMLGTLITVVSSLGLLCRHQIIRDIFVHSLHAGRCWQRIGRHFQQPLDIPVIIVSIPSSVSFPAWYFCRSP